MPKLKDISPEGGHKETLFLHKDKDCKHSVRYAGLGKDEVPFTVYIPRKWLPNPVPDSVTVTLSW